jgi:hypothetical protein
MDTNRPAFEEPARDAYNQPFLSAKRKTNHWESTFEGLKIPYDIVANSEDRWRLTP